MFVDPADLPTTGSATYTDDVGIVVDDGGSNLTLNGELTLNVGFSGAGTVTGDVSNFTDSNSADYTGSFNLTDGDIDRNAPSSDFTLFANLDGTITRDGSNVSYTSELDSASLGGDFFGTDGAATPEQVRGNFSGNLGRSVGGGAPVAVTIDETQSTFTAEQ